MSTHRFFFVISALLVGAIAEECDPKYVFENVQFKEVQLTKHEAMTTDVVISPSSGDLFFNEVITGIRNDFSVKILKNGDSTYKQIDGFSGDPQGITIDEVKDQVYFGSTEGLYKYNNVSGKAELFIEPTKYITSVYYSKNLLYFVTYPGFKPFKLDLEDGKLNSEPINIEYADGIVIDSKGNIFYLDADNDVYKYIHDTSEKVPIKGLPKKLITALGVDRVDVVFLAVDNEIYTIKKGATDAKHLVDVDARVTSFYFDKDDVMYTVIGDRISKFVVDESCT